MFYVAWCVCVSCEWLSSVLGVFGVFGIFWFLVWFLVPSLRHIYAVWTEPDRLRLFIDLGGHACPKSGEVSLDTPDLDFDLSQLKFLLSS